MAVGLFGFLTSSSATWLYCGCVRRLTSDIFLRAATQETEPGDHDFLLSRLHYTDTDPIRRQRLLESCFHSIYPGCFCFPSKSLRASLFLIDLPPSIYLCIHFCVCLVFGRSEPPLTRDQRMIGMMSLLLAECTECGRGSTFLAK